MNKRSKLFREIRKRYTKREGENQVWLVIDHQSFQLADYFMEDHESPRKHAEWRRDQLTIALARLLKQSV